MFEDWSDRRVNRRRLVRNASAATAGLMIASQPAFARGAAPSGARRLALQEVKSGGTLLAALPVDVTNFDPFLTGGTHGYMLARGLYNTLTRYDNDLQPQPELATDWAFSEDGLQLTLNLRSGVKYHSGRDFTADDVLFSLQAAQDETYAALNRALLLPITATAPSPTAVILSTEQPYAAMFDALDGLFIIDKETAEPNFPETGVGTGPFKQGELIPGDFARFDRFDDYWGGPAPLDAFELRPTPDLAAMAIALESQSIDVAWRLNYQDYVRLQESGDFTMLPGAEAALYYDIAMDTTHPVLSDKRVRQAVNWAVDRQRFVDTILNGIVGSTSIPYPQASLAYEEELANKFQKNLDQAKALITEAGHPDGFTAKLMTSTKRNPGMIELAQILQADLGTIGVTLEIEDLEPTVYDPRYLDSDFEMVIHTFGRANKDPATLFGGARAWYTDPALNPSKFTSDRYAELVNQGATTLDMARRKEIYHEITVLIQDECFCFPVAEQPRVWGMAGHVKDFVYSPDNMPLWHQVWLDK